jgi:hypothetical protein
LDFLEGQLERPFEEDEVKSTIFSCEGSRALGPNGFSITGFQTSWEVIKEDLTDVFKSFEKDGTIHHNH